MGRVCSAGGSAKGSLGRLEDPRFACKLASYLRVRHHRYNLTCRLSDAQACIEAQFCSRVALAEQMRRQMKELSGIQQENRSCTKQYGLAAEDVHASPSGFLDVCIETEREAVKTLEEKVGKSEGTTGSQMDAAYSVVDTFFRSLNHPVLSDVETLQRENDALRAQLVIALENNRKEESESKSNVPPPKAQPVTGLFRFNCMPWSTTG